jgi:prolycopene isomerase
VELDGRQRIEAPVVISNIDARETFEKLLRPDQTPTRYLRRLRRMELSHSILALYVSTDLNVRALGAQHDTTLHTDWDVEGAYARALGGDLPGLSILIPTLKDPSLAPPGEHLVILKAIAPRQAVEAQPNRGALAERMLELAEQVLPGLRQHLTFEDEGPAGAGSRVHLLGPYSGWAVTPQQSGVRRLPQETPVAGLLLVGQWTRPGLGISTVVQSGIGAARSALGGPTSAPALPLQV